jgi:hypothetical protein
MAKARLCVNGHKLTAANTRVTGGHGRKYVKCRQCANEAARKWAKKRAWLIKKLLKGRTQ